DGGVPAVGGDRRAGDPAGMTGRRPWTAGLRAGTALAVLVLLAACGSAPKKPSAPAGSAAKGGASAPVADGRCNGASPYAPAKEDPRSEEHTSELQSRE